MQRREAAGRVEGAVGERQPGRIAADERDVPHALPLEVASAALEHRLGGIDAHGEAALADRPAE